MRRYCSALFLLLILCGCSRLHSRGVTLQLINHENSAVSNLAVTFPGGSFGMEAIAPGASRSRWIKPLSTGALAIEFDDNSGHHSANLATLHAGEQTILTVIFSTGGKVAISG
jgi:hypothetical protein